MISQMYYEKGGSDRVKARSMCNSKTLSLDERK